MATAASALLLLDGRHGDIVALALAFRCMARLTVRSALREGPNELSLSETPAPAAQAPSCVAEARHGKAGCGRTGHLRPSRAAPGVLRTPARRRCGGGPWPPARGARSHHVPPSLRAARRAASRAAVCAVGNPPPSPSTPPAAEPTEQDGWAQQQLKMHSPRERRAACSFCRWAASVEIAVACCCWEKDDDRPRDDFSRTARSLLSAA